jgi:hypothetical protein
MERNEILRKAVHFCAPLFVLAYLIPEDLGIFSRDVLVIVLWLVFALVEIYRIREGKEFPGLRPYESRRPSAAFQMCTAFLIMILFFPVEYAFPLLLGFGVTDPLIGMLRKKGSKLYPIVPLLVYFTIMSVSLSFFYGTSFRMIIISLIVTISAISVESYRNRIVDDDFLMLFVPLMVLWILDSIV